MSLPTDITLDDKYDQERGRVLLSGTQALVRLPLMQSARDAAAGLRTAGYISGYRGSPLGGYDLQLGAAGARLAARHIRFVPGVNEDLAATAIWGTQQVGLLPGAKYDGVFAIWYGKGPGVDRSGDPIKHANRMGTAPHGGVLVLFGDDHPGKSSTISHQSEQALAANGVPVLYPATVQEFIDLGLHGFALSRYAGVWVGFKCVNETVEASATVEVDPTRIDCRVPAGEAPPGGLHARFGFDPLGDEVRLVRHKLPRVQAYARANGLDRVSHGTPRPGGLGIVAAGKSWLDAAAALAALGLDEPRLAALRVSLYKPALIWPLDPAGLAAFARGQRELLIVEEKAAFLEAQAAHALYNLPDGERPRLTGKRDEAGATLLPADFVLEPLEIARVVGLRLVALALADEALQARLAAIETRLAEARALPADLGQRTPYFCSGCPHNTSTRVPAGSVAFAGIGCHTMAIYMHRSTLPPTQMGGEGMTWAGMAPFTEQPHAFQNIGDGTYFHSGLLAIRAAAAAGVSMTYKILYNDAVAMTGGQPVEGHLTVAEITHQLRAERVGRIAVVSDAPGKYGRAAGFAAGVTVHDRDGLDALQRELRTVPGVSAIVYDQVCAAEKRRRRKRGRMADPARRVLINPLVCEGCGDCSVQSNCVSVEPLETEFGRKRAIDQSSCNKDYSCLKGFCPAFVTVDDAELRKPEPARLDAAAFASLPEPLAVDNDRTVSVLVTGIGGTGVVTVGAVLAMAAHLEGRSASVYDMTGLAQKGGAVLSHVRIAPAAAPPAAPRIGLSEADVVLGCDLVVSASPEVLRAIDSGRTRLALNTHLVPTAVFQLNPDVDFRARDLLARLVALTGAERTMCADATGTARALLGDTVGANLFMVGIAMQRGWLPLGRASLERAIELNGAAVALNQRALALGRLAAADPGRFAALLATLGARPAAPAGTPLEVRERFLAGYQDAAYAARYRALVERVAAAETERTPGRRELAAAVTRYYFKLLAYKDEYEVARLHAGAEFRDLVTATFGGRYRLRFHLAPPGLARRDPATGVPRKMSVGGWLLPVFGLLARLRVLRGTRFDPFGYSAERRLERRLIADYERLIDELLAGLTPERHALAVEIASLPEQVRGYGHVKARHLAAAEQRQAELLERFRRTGQPIGAVDRATQAPPPPAAAVRRAGGGRSDRAAMAGRATPPGPTPMSYTAPVEHMRFVLEHTAGLDRVRALPAFAEATPDVVAAVLEGAARFAGEVLAPLNAPGDRVGARVTPAGVVTPPGFREAYQRYVADGWNSLGGPPAYGGQGMPFVLQAATVEMWGGANMALALCPELSSGAIAALSEHATEALRARFLPQLVAGVWTGSMCLTEPQSGSDLSTVTTRAEPDGAAWRLYGRKIYITWGEHDMADNVLHLVLARAPNAPSGVKGLSLFLVPRFRVGADGRPGEANDIRCVSVEHKMGIHGSPTCVLAIGDGPGAEGFLVGPLHQGLACMFTMMNHMRLGVGLHALGVAEQAYQIASRHARERVQGRDAAGKPTVLLGHADVRRMLLLMKSQIQAARGLCYAAAAALDLAQHAAGEAAAAAQARADLLTPIVKAWGSDMAIEVTSLAVQVLGGMGFTEDAGAAQCYRDVRITAIYEGTNGIQAHDLLARKVLRDGGRALAALVTEMRTAQAELPAGEPRAAALGRSLGEGIAQLERATAFALAEAERDPELVGAIGVPYLDLAALVCGAWQWARALGAATRVGLDAQTRGALSDAAAFYAAQVMPRAAASSAIVLGGSAAVAAAERELV